MMTPTKASAVIGAMALATALLLAGCGSSTTAADPAASAPVPVSSAPVSPAPAETPAGPVEAAWTCANEGGVVTCTCQGTDAGCRGSVTKDSQVKGATGTVKWFNDSKGFGFITPDDGGEDLFAHFSAINMSGFKTLKVGQQVQFDVTDGAKGKQASNIQAN